MDFLTGSEYCPDFLWEASPKTPANAQSIWIACYRAADGRRIKKSTKKTEATWEYAEKLATEGRATTERIEEVLHETLRPAGV
jgi:hypothetical protein